jgi:hypothetical protein
MADVAAEHEKTHRKYFPDQFDDEEVLYVFRKHPVVMRKGIILWAFGMLAGPVYILILSLLYQHNPSKYPSSGAFFASLGASVVLSMILFAPSYIGWYFSVFIITDQRFIQITQKGFFHRAVSDLTLPQIQSVNYEVSGLQETLLGFGTIKMQTYVGDVTIHEVHHPAKIQKRILNILRQEGVTSSSYPSQSPPHETNEEA